MTAKRTRTKKSRAIGDGSNGKANMGSVRVGQTIPRPMVQSVFDVQRSFLRLVSGVLANSDLAWRNERTLQRQMLRDPDVISPLNQRKLAVALLDFDIVSEDENDSTQREQAEWVYTQLKRIRRWHDMVGSLQNAVWFGPAAVNIVYAIAPGGGARPVGWTPLHSDTLAFTHDGQLGIRVGYQYDRRPTVSGFDSPVALFDELERRAIVLHTFSPEGPDYEEPRESRYMWSGRGLRDVCFHFWMMKQVALQLWINFTERYGMGIRKLFYPEGNDEIKAEVEEMARNAIGDVTFILPRPTGDNASVPTVDLEIMDPATGSRQNLFADLIKGYLAGQIKEVIVGQTATTQATNTGLGSDVGTRHAETFNRIVKMDAHSVADSITHDMVIPMHVWRYGDTPYRPRLEFSVEEIDSEKFMAGVKDYVELGGSVSDRQVRKRIGIEAPRDDDELLRKSDPFEPLDGPGFDVAAAIGE